MKKYLAIAFIFYGFTLTVNSQNPLPQSCYMRLEGFMDQQTKIILHLVKMNDSLYGDYNSKMVFGKTSAKGKFWLREWPGDNGVEIKGQFKDQRHLTVTWNGPDLKDKKLTFDLAEKFPDGSIPMKVFFETAVRKLTRDAKSPQASVKMALLVPVMTENHAPGLDSLNRILLDRFSETTENKVVTESAEKLLDSVKMDFLENYVSGNEAMYKEMPGASYEWELLKFIHIIYNDDYKLTFYILNYAFTGGAHGIETQVYTSFDLKTGRAIVLSDLLKPGYENRLTVLLTGKLHQILKLPVKGKLTESGYFVDEIKPNDNFYLNAQGIGFFYNHYEIAPYSFGATDIFLTRDELKGLLK